MNKPRITKQTLKELRGELMAKQQSQGQNENTDKTQSNLTNNQKSEAYVEHENEDGMNM